MVGMGVDRNEILLIIAWIKGVKGRIGMWFKA